MTESTIWINATPAEVWAVLADPRRYSDWVVGTTESFGVEGEWPDEGSALRWETGVGPARAGDRTHVLRCEPRRRLDLRAELGALGAVDVHVELIADGDGTTAKLAEEATAGAARVASPVVDAVNAVRTAFSLERLKEIVEP
jgi:uncharacterized protein YndB with AHSA1/START domain